MTTSRHRWLAHLLPSVKFIIALGILHIIAVPGSASAARPSGHARAAAPQVGAEGRKTRSTKATMATITRGRPCRENTRSCSKGRPSGHNGRTGANIQEVAAQNDAQARLAASPDARNIAGRARRFH